MKETKHYHAIHITKDKCIGCVHCMTVCPAKAIRLGHYTDDQIMIKVDALLEGAI